MRKISAKAVAVGSMILSLIVLAVPLAVTWALRERLPERIATHFGPDGQPDGWSSLPVALLWHLTLGLFMSVVLLGLGLGTRSMRFMGPFAVGISALIAVAGYGSMLGQLDGGMAKPGPLVFFGLLPLILIPAVGWWWLKDRMEPVPVEATGTFTPSLPGHPEVRSWSGETRRGKAAVVMAVVIGLLGAGMLVLFRGDPWLMAAIGILVFGTIPLMFLGNQRITIDGDGVTGKALGIRLHHTPLDEVLSAGHVQVDPLGDFGGVGFRGSIDGRRDGLVTGAGDALIFQRRGQKDYVITVEQAVEAARVLEMLVEERQSVRSD